MNLGQLKPVTARFWPWLEPFSEVGVMAVGLSVWHPTKAFSYRPRCDLGIGVKSLLTVRRYRAIFRARTFSIGGCTGEIGYGIEH